MKRIGVSERRQARFLRAAYRCLTADPFVAVALWFGLQDIPGSAHARGYAKRASGDRTERDRDRAPSRVAITR